MAEGLELIEGHIPPDILNNNPNLAKYAPIINGLLKLRKDEIDKYTRSFLFPLVDDIRIMRRFVDEWKAEYTEQSTRICIDCLYRNYYDIYSRKGTRIGLIKLLTCLFWQDEQPTVTVDSYVMGKPLILFDDDRAYDWLPEGQDIANETEALPGEEVWCPTLLDTTWLDCKVTIDITVTLNYTPTPEFLEFIRGVIVLYLPMVSRDFVIINLNILP